MIDRQAMSLDLQQARQARADAQAAVEEVEELIAAVQRFEPGRQFRLFVLDCGEVALAAN